MGTGFDLKSKVNFNKTVVGMGQTGKESFYVLIHHSFKFREKMWILGYKKEDEC